MADNVEQDAVDAIAAVLDNGKSYDVKPTARTQAVLLAFAAAIVVLAAEED